MIRRSPPRQADLPKVSEGVVSGPWLSVESDGLGRRLFLEVRKLQNAQKQTPIYVTLEAQSPLVGLAIKGANRFAATAANCNGLARLTILG